FGYGWYEAHHIIATRYQVETQKAVEPLHLVQITDSHLGATFDGEGFAQAIERIQSENPDVVVITGDFVDDDSSREDMMRSCEALKTLETKYGVYFVFGNHDKGYYNNERRGYDADDLILELEKNGVTVLQDEKVLLGDSYELIGRQDRSEEDFGRTRASMEELVSESNPEKYQIVLDHQPNDFENQEKTGVDLVLSGHTHGGQFFPINRLGEWFGLNDMTYGIRKNGNTTFEVSSGISDWAIKFKTGCKAEYVVIDIA
ncbi:MAG: metallophosphoesterase, partial [Eubacteriales bacterium]|nr:metallophosphoesterase [Eubacteriales bacterium]